MEIAIGPFAGKIEIPFVVEFTLETLIVIHGDVGEC
jgi:hypothetical protein